MKKRILKLSIYSFIALSAISFIYLNISNPEFPLLDINHSVKSFDVPASTLPDVEAVKNTLLLFKEMFTL